MRAAALLLLVALAIGPWVIAGARPTRRLKESLEDQFVRVQGNQFVVGCQAWYASGWNEWETMEAGAGALTLYGSSLPPNITAPELVRKVLDRAVAHGANVVRAWAQPVTMAYALESSPGVYNEGVFRGLDYLLDEARQRGLRLLLVLLDNWQPDGADTIVGWVDSSLTHEDFFSNPQAKQLYKDRVTAILSRVNTVNGRKYSEDPTIFAWDLINEPRCYQCGDTTRNWVSEMAAHVKSLDPNHLLTIGEEGFYPQFSDASAANPQGYQSWAFWEGQNFYWDHNDPNIDFTAIHLWPDNWLDPTTDFVNRWIARHIQDSSSLGKPMILEEFGKYKGSNGFDERNQFYQLIYDLIKQDAQSGGPSAGALFFQYYAEGQKAPSEEDGGVSGLFGVFEADSTFSVIDGFTTAMQALTGSSVQGCSAPSSVAVQPVRNCSASWVHGLPGTGYEGPDCSLDINECVRGTDNCALGSAACVNTDGGFTCKCAPGYTGDGVMCVQDVAQATAIRGSFVTMGPAALACDEGTDVTYPEGALGFAYDPTGGLASVSGTQSGAESAVAVSPEQCMGACTLAPGCTAFSYNPTLQKCFLKSHASTDICTAKETVCMSARETQYSCGTWQTYYRSGVNGQSVPDLTPTDPKPSNSSPAAGSSPTSSPANGESQATINLTNAVNAAMQDSSPSPTAAGDNSQINLTQVFGVAG